MSIRSLSTLTRRRLLGVASAVIGAPIPAALARGAPPPPAAQATRTVVLLETYVAGAAYYDARRLLDDLRPGESLRLRREPTNPHDAMAIEVFRIRGEKLGYVPRALNEPFARLMDAGEAVSAEIVAIAPEEYEDIRMRLGLECAVRPAAGESVAGSAAG